MERLIDFCEKLVPGNPLKPPEILIGGALHKTWKVTTDCGLYCLKEIHPEIAKKQDVLKKYETTEQIAHAFYKAGLPAIAAIEIDTHFVHSFEGSLFMIYPFTQGHIIPPEKIDQQHAQIVGSLFKTMHECNLSLNLEETLPYYDLFSDDHWITIIENSQEKKLIELLPTILTWNHRYQEAIPKLNRQVLISHRDLHYSNVLWNGLEPAIIDWESAGYTNPHQEILGFALEWSGIIQSQFRKEIFQTIVKSYAPQGFTFSEDAFFGWLGNSVLGWTEFNIRRSFDNTFSTSERAKGHDILTNKMIPCLTFIKERNPLYVWS